MRGPELELGGLGCELRSVRRLLRALMEPCQFQKYLFFPCWLAIPEEFFLLWVGCLC